MQFGWLFRALTNELRWDSSVHPIAVAQLDSQQQRLAKCSPETGDRAVAVVLAIFVVEPAIDAVLQLGPLAHDWRQLTFPASDNYPSPLYF